MVHGVSEGSAPKFLIYTTTLKEQRICWKEQYGIGTWNAKSMNQGKLQLVKEEMARVNVNILRISELKWTGMG